MISTSEIGPGNVLAVKTAGVAADAIQIGSALLGKTAAQNHILVLHHQTNGRWWGIEGRPGGVGWRDATDYLGNPFTIANSKQPLTAMQRTQICNAMQRVIAVHYDWEAIAQDFMRDLHLPAMPDDAFKGQLYPSHVVCSSVSAWAYGKSGAAYPRQVDMAHIEPADWVEFILENSYS